MYGMVNQGVKDLVVSKFGIEAWEKVCKKAGIGPEDFEFLGAYPDKLTYGLVGAASEVLQIPADAILTEFGKYWIHYTAKEGFGPIMDLFGADFRSCLNNLNNLHARMGMTMPNLSPPKFHFHEENGSFLVEYESTRPGLQPMVKGLLEALAAKYNTKVAISFEIDKQSGKTLFRIGILGVL